MAIIIKTRRSRENPIRREWPVIASLGTFGGGFWGYAITRVALYTSPHPDHWADGLAGALLGCGGGWLWFHRRGDII